MATPRAAFTRNVLHQLEMLLCSDHNRNFSQMDRTLRHMLAELYGRADDTGGGGLDNLLSSGGGPMFVGNRGFIGNGFRVIPSASPNTSVRILRGVGFHYLTSGTLSSDGLNVIATNINNTADPDHDAFGVDDESPLKPLVLMADQTLAIPNLPVTGGEAGDRSRTDIIEVRVNRQPMSEDGGLTDDYRAFLNDVSGVYETYGPFQKCQSFFLDGSTQFLGAAGGTPTAAIVHRQGSNVDEPNPASVPATDNGYIKIAELFITNTQTVVNWVSIRDWRNRLWPSATAAAVVNLTKPSNTTDPPSSVEINAPTGVEVYVVSDDVSSNAFHIYVVGTNNGNPVGAYASIGALASPGTTTTIQVAPYLYPGTNPDYITLTDDDCARIASARCHDIQNLCFGQAAIHFKMFLSYGSVDAPNVIVGAPTGDVRVSCTLTLGTYLGAV